MYTKYHGCGNDFIIGEYQKNIDYEALAKKCCDRHLGLGADGLILAEKKNGTIKMHLYNSDGSIAPMCGNGIRCFSHFCIDMGLVDSNEFCVETMSGLMKICIESRSPFYCKVSLGFPSFSTKKLDIDTLKEEFLDEVISVNGKNVKVNAVYMATHHLVVIVDDLNEAIKSGIAEELGKNKIFKKGINVDLVEIIDEKNIKMKTYERGAGWTLACGTGASAAYVILKKKNLCLNELNVHLEYGVLKISSLNEEIFMMGPSECIAKNIELN